MTLLGNKSQARILVAGIGNIFLGDDAFGVRVAQRLALCRLPDEACIVDFGIRSFDLIFAIADGYELVILIDAAQNGGAPGTLYLIEPNRDIPDEFDDPSTMVDAHTMDPVKVLRMARRLGASPKRILLVGCEPQRLMAIEGQMELSAPVESAVDEAIRMVQRLIVQHLETSREANTLR